MFIFIVLFVFKFEWFLVCYGNRLVGIKFFSDNFIENCRFNELFMLVYRYEWVMLVVL